jgi:hypothetical protein
MFLTLQYMQVISPEKQNPDYAQERTKENQKL